MSERHEGIKISLSAVDKAGLWDVREAGGEVIGQVQEIFAPEGWTTGARIVGYEGYPFPALWAAAYALAYGLEATRQEMRMIGY